jgi:tetratricopeptide (TPR) repeat protein
VVNELARHTYSAGQEQASTVADDALRVDPLNPFCWTQASFHWRFAPGRLADTEHAARRAIDLSERGNPVRTYAAHTLAVIGRREEAIAVFDEMASALGNSPYGSISAFLSRALQGDADGAVGHVTPLLERSAHWVEYLAWFLAEGYALIGRRDDALRWLQESVERGFINYPVLATHDPFLESLRGDTGYEALMQQVQRRWQAFDAC